MIYVIALCLTGLKMSFGYAKYQAGGFKNLSIRDAQAMRMRAQLKL